MDPLTRVVMVVLCAYCTVSAQKPGNANGSGGGGSNAPPMTVQQPNGVSDAASAVSGTVIQRASQLESQDASQAEPLSAPSEPSRVVFQSTPADDPRTSTPFSGEPGWGAPVSVPVTPELDALSFAGGGTNVPSPLCFPDATNITVQTILLAACGDAADLATLVDAPDTVRLRVAPAGAPEPEMSGAERALTEQFQPARWLVLGVDLQTPTNLPSLFFGGSAGRPNWSRNWRGEIAEIVGFNTPPGADVRAGVANYLAARWGFVGYPATQEQRQAAVDAGLHYGSVWGTVLFIR